MKYLPLVIALLFCGGQSSGADSAPTLPTVERTVYVSGAVTKPGHYRLPPGRVFTIVDAISLAGGPTRLADLKEVKLTRKNSKGESITIIIDLHVIMRSDGRGAPALQIGDVVFVPERCV